MEAHPGEADQTNAGGAEASVMPFNPASLLLSRYSSAANKLIHSCDCCQETEATQKEAELVCADGSTVKHVYVVVEACRCMVSECVVQPTSKTQRRRRR